MNSGGREGRERACRQGEDGSEGQETDKKRGEGKEAAGEEQSKKKHN